MNIFYDMLALLISSICIGNHMIQSAIWDKSAQVIFSKTNQIAPLPVPANK